jgi:hypothetical protein
VSRLNQCEHWRCFFLRSERKPVKHQTIFETWIQKLGFYGVSRNPYFGPKLYSTPPSHPDMGFSPPLVHKCHLIFTHAPFLILFSLLLNIFSHFILQFTLIPVLVPFSFNALPPFHSIFSVFPLYGLNIAYGTPCIYLSLHAVAVNFDTFWRWGESGTLADDPVQRGGGLSRPPHQEARQGGHALLHVATESFNILILLLPLGLPHLKGQCHEIFYLWFFSSDNFSWPQ